MERVFVHAGTVGGVNLDQLHDLAVVAERDNVRSASRHQLRAAGPFANDAGALWALEAASSEAAGEIIRDDPLVEIGVITS